MLRKPNLAIPNRRVAVGDAERHRHVGRLKTTLVRKQPKLGRSHGLFDTCMLGDEEEGQFLPSIGSTRGDDIGTRVRATKAFLRTEPHSWIAEPEEIAISPMGCRLQIV